jgi:hypothetical protein
MCVLAVTLQGVDVWRLREAVAERYVAAETRLFPAALADSPAVAGRPWTFVPAFFCPEVPVLDRFTITQLSLVAVRSGGTSNSTPTARPQGDNCPTPPDSAMTTAVDDPRIVVVLRGDQDVGGYLSQFALRSDCRGFPRGLICGRDLAGVPGLEPVRGMDLVPVWPASGATMTYEGKEPVSPVLGTGWSLREPDQIWSDGPEAWVTFRLPAGAPSTPVTVTFEARAFAPPGLAAQPVDVVQGDRVIASWRVTPGPFNNYAVTVSPLTGEDAGLVVLRLDLPRNAPPGGGDGRHLAFGVHKITVTW